MEKIVLPELLQRKKRAESQKRWGLQNLRWVPFSIHVGVDNKDEARLSTSWSTRDSFRRLAPHVQQSELKLVMNKSRSWCPCCKGLGCRKAGEMLLNVQRGHMELLLLRKITCFLILYIYISCGDMRISRKFWCEKFHEPHGPEILMEKYIDTKLSHSFGSWSFVFYPKPNPPWTCCFSLDHGEICVLNVHTIQQMGRLCFGRKRVMLFCSWYGLLESCFGVSCHAEQRCSEPICVVSLEGLRTDLQMSFHYKWNFPKSQNETRIYVKSPQNFQPRILRLFFLWKVLAASKCSIWLTKMRHGSIWAVAFWHPDGPEKMPCNDPGIRVEIQPR